MEAWACAMAAAKMQNSTVQSNWIRLDAMFGREFTINKIPCSTRFETKMGYLKKPSARLALR